MIGSTAIGSTNVHRKRVLILYGSQTGQAKAISEQIYERCVRELNASENNLFIANYGLDLTEKRFSIDREQLAVFVVSTTGEGEPPDNARKFWRRIQKRTLPNDYLNRLHFALLGLGDSNYNRFANFGRDLERRLLELGANPFFRTGFGDEAVGTEVGVEPWVHDLIPALLHHLGLYDITPIPKVVVEIMSHSEKLTESTLMASVSPLSELTELSLPLITKKLQEITVQKFEDTLKISQNFFYTKTPVMDSNIIDAKITSIKCLTKNFENDAFDEKVVLEATIESDDKDFPTYLPGDSFGFICGNRDEEVDIIMKILGVENCAEKIFSIKCKGLNHLPELCSLRNYFKYYCELRSVPMKSCLRCFADFCSDVLHKRRLLELSSREGGDDYTKFVRSSGVNVLDILQMFDSCKPSLEAFFANVPCFVPRYYSVGNLQPKGRRGHFRIAFTVAKLDKICCRQGTQLKGVFTGYMQSLFQNSNQSNIETYSGDLLHTEAITEVKIFKRKNRFFKLPQSSTAPLILVAPGTGVVPFISFLEERALLKSDGLLIGESWLFFGCRHSNQDFIYEELLHKFEQESILSRLCTCFSREETSSEKYVQDLIEKHSRDLSRLIQSEDCMIYVCGDMKKMSVTIFNSFVNIIENEMSFIREDAVQFVRNLQLKKRYLEDVWI